MNTRAIKFCAVLVVCLATMVIAHEQAGQQRETIGNGISIGEIRLYRQMFRANETPVDMVEGTKMMCAPPQSIFGPHYDPGVVYYINDIARQGLGTFSTTRMFPVGSVIVKEKQERKTEDSVQIITVMKKVRSEQGEDSWDYRMYDTKKWTEIDVAKQTTSSPKRTCIECHRRYKDNDYVSDKGIELLLRK